MIRLPLQAEAACPGYRERPVVVVANRPLFFLEKGGLMVLVKVTFAYYAFSNLELQLPFSVFAFLQFSPG